MPTYPAAHAAALALVILVCALALLALSSCGGDALTLRADGPPPSTFGTPRPVLIEQAAAPARPTADVKGTVTP